MQGRTETQTAEMQFLQEIHPVPRTPDIRCFHMLKDYLQEALILRYPDPAASYTLYTDASKYAYAGVLTQ